MLLNRQFIELGRCVDLINVIIFLLNALHYQQRVLHSLSARDLKKLEQGAKLRDIKSQLPPPPPEKPKQEREYRRQNAKRKGKPLKNEENNKPPVNKKLDIDLPPPPPLPHREESNVSADSETLKDKNYPTQLLCAAFSSEESEQEHLTPFKPSFNNVTTNVSLENNTQSPDLSAAEQLPHPCRTQTDDAASPKEKLVIVVPIQQFQVSVCIELLGFYNLFLIDSVQQAVVPGQVTPYLQNLVYMSISSVEPYPLNFKIQATLFFRIFY